LRYLKVIQSQKRALGMVGEEDKGEGAGDRFTDVTGVT
jgi:hypothetical protein